MRPQGALGGPRLSHGPPGHPWRRLGLPKAPKNPKILGQNSSGHRTRYANVPCQIFFNLKQPQKRPQMRPQGALGGPRLSHGPPGHPCRQLGLSKAQKNPKILGQNSSGHRTCYANVPCRVFFNLKQPQKRPQMRPQGALGGPRLSHGPPGHPCRQLGPFKAQKNPKILGQNSSGHHTC